MQIRFRICLCLLALLACACSETEDGAPVGAPIDVTIGTRPGAGIDVRTSLEEDGITVRWAAGDRIALWALDSGGQAQFEAAPFSLYSFNETYRSALFTGTVDPMPANTYSYYAVSPVPAAVDGLRASFDIPSVQNGSFDGACDVMVAAPAKDMEALVAGDNSDRLQLAFTHKIHVLKIHIPDNRMGLPIQRLELTFPVPVTGRLTVDAADPQAAPALTDADGSGRVLSLRFDTPKNAGDTVYAIIAPVELTADERIEIKAYSGKKESLPAAMPGKNYREGHTTPIRLTIPEMLYVPPTVVVFSLDGDGTATLGEPILRFTVSAPAGCDLGEGSNARTFEVNDTNRYEISFEDGPPDGLAGQFEVSYESESALVTRGFPIPDLKKGEENTVPAFDVPYLLEERFDTVESYSDNEKAQGANNDPAAIWIPGLSGWSAARTGGSAGLSVCIVGHREGGMWVPADYEARMDSAPLSGLKQGVSVPVRISFNYSGSTNKGAPKFKYGTSNAQGLINGANTGIESQAGNVAANTTGSYNKVDQAIAPFTATCSNTTRITWVAYGDDGIPFSLSYYFYYIYIDNVTVSIEK